MKALIMFSSLVLFIFSDTLLAQPKSELLTSIVEEYVSSMSPGIAVLATKNGEVVYEYAQGLSDFSSGEKLNTDQVFRIGSVTKQFTAVAILKLAEEGKLQLDDPISKYVGEEVSAPDITIRQLLHHTSGLGNQQDLAEFRMDEIKEVPEEMIPPILGSTLKFPAGSAYAYSNLGYILLGHIIEEVTGRTYENYLQDEFFFPLKMDNTGFEYISDFSSKMAKGHSPKGETFKYADPINMQIPFAAGGMVSSLQDLSKWNKAVMGGKLISQANVDQLQGSHVLANGELTGYSQGWQIGNIQGVKTVKHDGIVNGFTAMAIYLPEEDLFVAALSNCDKNRDIEIPTSEIAAVLMGKPFRSEPLSLSMEALKKYQGTYQSNGKEMQIVAHDDVLMYYKKGGAKTILLPTEDGKFLLSGSLDQVLFREGEDGFSFLTLGKKKSWERTGPLEGYYSLELNSEAEDEYIGRYQVPGKFVFEVYKEAGKMYGKIGNDPKEIFSYAKDRFTSTILDAKLDFVRGEAGEITKLKIDMGPKFTADKL
ncbi:MAG: serine hydrolase [Bacteroidota bacterium]